MRSRTIYILIITLFFSCLDEVSINSQNSSGKLVINGEINNKKGPYTINLNYSKDFFDTSQNSPESKVSNAKVQVEDNMGNSEAFLEVEPGVYKSSEDGMLGLIGLMYKLSVELEDGEQYESIPSAIMPNNGIEKLVSEYEKKEVLNENDIVISIDGMNVSLIPNNSITDTEFYRWRWHGTYEIETFPQLADTTVGADSLGRRVLWPDPLECSGYRWIPPRTKSFHIEYVKPCECCTCWITEYTQKILLSELSANTSNLFLNFIENSNSRFSVKYHLNVEQLSISKQEREFWKIVSQQQDNGSLFTTANASVPSNVYNIRDDSEVVLGYFSTVAIEEKTLELSSQDLQRDPVYIDTMSIDCIGVANSTNVKPEFW